MTDTGKVSKLGAYYYHLASICDPIARVPVATSPDNGLPKSSACASKSSITRAHIRVGAPEKIGEMVAETETSNGQAWYGYKMWAS